MHQQPDYKAIPTNVRECLIEQKPLLIVDADEVLLQFVKALEGFLNRNGYYMRFDSFQLSGNIRRETDDTPIDQAMTSKLIADFFTHDVEKVEAVPGASKALQSLSDEYQIVVLSNVPEHVQERRQQHLINLGMNYPLIANKGGKGMFAQQLSGVVKAKTAFVDDLPPQHTSIAQSANHIHRIHMIVDKRLAKLISKAEDAHVRIDKWDDAVVHLFNYLSKE